MSNPTPYVEKSRGYRRDRFVAKRWRVATDAQGQGVFFCHHLVPGSAQWGEQDAQFTWMSQTHASIHFLSQVHARQGWWYRARMSTVEQAVLEALGVHIDAQVEQEVGIGVGLAYWRAQRDAWQALTPTDWEALPVSLGVTRNLKDPEGVRLDVVLPDPVLDVSTIKRFVEGFWTAGEVESSQPVDWPAHRPSIQASVDRVRRVYSRLSNDHLQD